jgi:hypothetical protein
MRNGQIEGNNNNVDVIRTVNRILFKTLKQTNEWVGWCVMFMLITLGLCVVYLATIDVDNIKKGYLTVNYIILVCSVIWLSITVRDRKNEDLIKEYSQQVPAIASFTNKWASSFSRMIIGWVFFSIAIIIFVVGMVTFNLDRTAILNGILVEVGLTSAVFQLVKVVQDRLFANSWETFVDDYDRTRVFVHA